MADSVQNFAYHPNVASWVQSTALAQLDGASDEVAERSPDDLYKSTPTPTPTPTHTHTRTTEPPANMASTRQRQRTPNGAARSTAKPSVRSVSGSVTSTTSTPRSTPQVPVDRPTVRSLAQKFNQPTSADSSPLSSRSRTVRAEPPSYSGYKSNHLKVRERSQPAPSSPAQTRRSNGIRSSLQSAHASPARTRVTSPARDQGGRQPFFGEVVGEHNTSTPGFGIPSFEDVPQRVSAASAPPETLTIKLVAEEDMQVPQDADGNRSHRRSPPSRIPVSTRRLSASSGSSTSTRSSKFNGARPVQYNRSSPPEGSRIARRPVRSSIPAVQPIHPAPSYRGYRERGKAPAEANGGPSVSAVITAPPPPTSPRLRNSRERQMLQEAPGTVPRPTDGQNTQDSTTPYQPQSDATPVDSKLSVKLVDASPKHTDFDVPSSPLPEFTVNGENLDVQPLDLQQPAHQPSLTLTTDCLQVPPAGQPSSSVTSFDFDESPVLGMPGSFMLTPPLAQQTPPTNPQQFEAERPQSPLPSPELLQARTFQPPNHKRISRIISIGEMERHNPELGSQESIPIMLGCQTDGPADDRPWEVTPKGNKTPSFGDEEPEDPFGGGTAIIFPTESKRYSRSSHNSAGSATTTIWEGQSHADSSSGFSSREHERGVGVAVPQQATPMPPRPPYSPPPPPTPAMNNALNTASRHLSSIMAQRERSFDLTPVGQRVDPDLQESEGSRPESAAETTEPEKPVNPLDEETRQVQKRYRIIEELTKTEHTFCVDMMVAHQIFMNTAKEVLNEKEIRLLFGNCKDVEAFSHGLWKELKNAIRPIVNQTPPTPNSMDTYDEFLCCTPANDRLVNIGEIMLKATIKMERVYTTYYLNHSDASDFIKANSENGALLGWVMACFNHCPNLTSAWDLDSLLVKPCQRMLKYPLLLDELVAKTSPDHPDLPRLKEANQAIKNIATRIQDAKARQQTLRAATSEGKKKEKKKGVFGKNIVRALQTKDRSKSIADAASAFEDKEYNSITQKFGGHFFQIQIVIRDYEHYLDQITDQTMHLNNTMMSFITVAEAGPSANAEMESTWRQWAHAHLELQSKALDEHKRNVRDRVMKPISHVWDQWAGPQKLMEQRKKLLFPYAKYKQSIERKDRVGSQLEENAKDFMTINDSLKVELPKLYDLTKKMIRLTEVLFLSLTKDWYKTCSKKILPLLDHEPEHTTSITYDFKTYIERFKSDWGIMEERARGFAIINHDLLNKIATFATPNTAMYSADDSSSRKSTSRRTESISSELSTVDRTRSSEYSAAEQRNRNSGGYASARSSNIRSVDPTRPSPPTSHAYPSQTPAQPSSHNPRAYSQSGSENTVVHRGGRPSSSTGRPPPPSWPLGFDGACDDYTQPALVGPSFLNPTPPSISSFASPASSSTTPGGSSRASGVFSSALPLPSDNSPPAAELPPTPGDPEDVEVLFLAASLFEFNIAHDRREGGIPYLVYVPGEIFDVIGMKGELWLARNQDDGNKTVGWIWEKHFARILPEEA
ncbi:hypothetical protein P280DRAFT_515249 [Massarina eburnea CBS 473.64]|uniref:DH domain-containing protein n=1 Tax=Massarina eburnea CBS 473.64 TaxID=1395130 RepID=A0A6A6SD11_9PLEO|nr:hypothetical protein P280DRAFT_515249 [Massarina eburnea CBS 473.64]